MTASTTEPTTARDASARPRAVLATMWIGLALTVFATAAPFVDDATTRLLAGHIGTGYPSYSAEEIGTAVGLYLTILSAVGGAGILIWLGLIWAARTGKRWAAWAATAVLLVTACIALTGLTVTDTSGEAGLVPVLAWLQVLPCVAGAVVVAQLWRRRR